MIKRILLILLMLSVSSFATETAYAWGYGDLMVETLKIVKYIFSVNEFQDAWKLAMIISMTVTTIAMMTPQTDFMRLPKVIFMSTGVWTIFTVNTIDIYVDDKADNTKSAMVTQVPWAVGYPVALFTTLEYTLGNMYETATSIPSGMKYSDSGFFTPISIFSQATQHKIVDPNLYQNVSNYIQDCVIPDLENGYKDYITLSESDNIWSYMSNTSPATFVMFIATDNSTSLVTCPIMYNSLNGLLNMYTSSTGKGMGYLGKTLGISSVATISNMLGISNQFLTNSSKTASQMLLQNTALNTFNDSFKSYVAANGGDLNSAALHSATAESQAQAQMIISGVLGSKYIPIIKGILTVVVLGLTPILALMMITPIGFKTVIGYVLMLFWLSCWHFGDAILNHIIITKAQSAMSSYGDTTLLSKGLIDSTVTDYINMASSMYWAIPTIALVIASGFSLAALTALNTSLTSGLNRTVAASGGEMGKGNTSYGSISHDNYTANKSSSTNAFDIGTTGAMNNGAFSYKSNLSSISGSASSDIHNKQEGNMSMTSNIANDRAVSLGLMNGGGQSYSFSNFKGSLEASGSQTSDGREIYSGSGVLSNSSGQTAIASPGAMFTKERDGSYQLYQGKLDGISSKDMAGNPLTTSIEMSQGKELSRTVSDNKGDVITSRTLEDGKKAFTWKSGLDSGSSVSGIYNPSTNRVETATDGDITGGDITKANKGSTTFSASTSSKVAKSLADSWSSSMSKNEGSDTSKGSSQKLTYGADGRLEINTKDQLAGYILAKGTGVGANAGMGIGISYDNNGGMSFKTGKGKSEEISLSGEARKMFEDSLQKNMSQEESLSLSRNLESGVLKDRLNLGLANGRTVDDTMEGIVRSKDGFFSGNTPNNGVKDLVSNSNVNIPDSKTPTKIENSENYDDKWKRTNTEIKKDAIVANNKSEDLRNKDESGYDRKTDKVVDETKFDKKYEQSRDEKPTNYALDSLGQKIENSTGGLSDLGNSLKDKAGGIAPGIENSVKETTKFDEWKDLKGSDIKQKINGKNPNNTTNHNDNNHIEIKEIHKFKDWNDIKIPENSGKTKSDGDFNVTNNYNSSTFDIMNIKHKGNSQPIKEINEK